MMAQCTPQKNVYNNFYHITNYNMQGKLIHAILEYHTNKYKQKHELVYYQLACTTLHHVVIMCVSFNIQLTVSLHSRAAPFSSNHLTASVLLLIAAICNGVHLFYKK